MTTATATCLFDNIVELPSLTQEGGKSNEWYTPARYIEAAREVMGSIDLDPASCAVANQTVKATRYYTKEDNGLQQGWYGRVWLNPPYGRIHPELTGSTRSWQPLFIQKLLRDFLYGEVEQAIILLLGNALFKQWFPSLWEYPICVHETSIAFKRPGRKHHDTDRLGFGSIFIYLGPNEQKFIEVFSQFGRIAKAIDTPRQPIVPLSLWEEV